MAIYKVHLRRECVGPDRWKLLCEFANDPGNPRIASEEFPSEEAILDQLHNERVQLNPPPAERAGDRRWLMISSKQLRNLGIPEIYRVPSLIFTLFR